MAKRQETINNDPLARTVEALLKQVEAGPVAKEVLEGLLTAIQLQIKFGGANELQQIVGNLSQRVDQLQNMVGLQRMGNPKSYGPPSIG